MALFDSVHVHPSLLPADAPEWMRESPYFLTYDLGKGMSDYAFEENGRFVMSRHLLAGIIADAFQTDAESFPAVPVP